MDKRLVLLLVVVFLLIGSAFAADFSSWLKHKEFKLYDTETKTNHTRQFFNFTGLTLTNAPNVEVRIADASDLEIPFYCDIYASVWTAAAGEDYAYCNFFANTTAGANVTYKVYYDKAAASAPNYDHSPTAYHLDGRFYNATGVAGWGTQGDSIYVAMNSTYDALSILTLDSAGAGHDSSVWIPFEADYGSNITEADEPNIYWMFKQSMPEYVSSGNAPESFIGITTGTGVGYAAFETDGSSHRYRYGYTPPWITTDIRVTRSGGTDIGAATGNVYESYKHPDVFLYEVNEIDVPTTFANVTVYNDDFSQNMTGTMNIDGNDAGFDQTVGYFMFGQVGNRQMGHLEMLYREILVARGTFYKHDVTFWLGAEVGGYGATSVVINNGQPSGNYWETNIPRNYTYNSEDWTTGACYQSIDGGGFDYIGNATNGTANYDTFSTTVGSHEINITCESPIGNFSDASSFAVVDYLFINETYTTTDYESNTSLFQLWVNASSNVDNVTASLSWNGTTDSPTGTDTANLWFFNSSATVPLLAVNTSAAFWWNYTINLANGTSINDSTTPVTQGLNQSYIINSINNTPSIVTEGDEITFRARIDHAPVTDATISAVTFLVNDVAGAGTLEKTETDYSIYYLTTYAPAGSGVSYYNATFTLTFDGDTLNKTSSTSNYTSYQIEATNCSAGTNSTTRFIVFTSADEIGMSYSPNYTLEISFNIVKPGVDRTFNFTFPDTNNTHEICFFPPNATMTTNATMKFYNTTSSVRYYYLSNAILTNDTTYITHYLLPSTLSTQYTFYVVDESNQKVEGAIVDIERYLVGDDKFVAVAMGQTDEASGATNINLQATENLYRAIVILRGAVAATQYPLTLTGTSITLPLSQTTYVNYYLRQAQISATCTNVTNSIVCSFADVSGLNPTVTLDVDRAFALTNVSVCESSTTGASGTLVCPLGNYTGTTFFWTLKAAYSGGLTLLLESGAWSYIGPPHFKYEDGLFYTLALVVAGATMFALVSPSAVVFGAVFGLAISRSLYLFDMSWEALMALMLLAAIVAYKLRW